VSKWPLVLTGCGPARTPAATGVSCAHSTKDASRSSAQAAAARTHDEVEQTPARPDKPLIGWRSPGAMRVYAQLLFIDAWTRHTAAGRGPQHQYKELLADVKARGKKQVYILKPDARCQHLGIRLLAGGREEAAARVPCEMVA